MRLANEFEIDTDIDTAWTLLTDLERIAPCMPGATLDRHEGDEYFGKVKVKVGPIGAHFAGTARFVERDDQAYSALVTAAGKDPRGQASASADVNARLEAVSPTRTRVVIDTDLDVSGRMAQFGRGAIADVSNRLIGQFVTNLAVLLTELDSGTDAGVVQEPAVRGTAREPATRTGGSRVVDEVAGGEASMDVMSIVLPVIKERYGQALLGGLIGFALSWLAFGRRRAR